MTQIPIDPELRAQTLRVIEAYKGEKSEGLWGRARVAAMKTISDFLAAYDKGELSVPMQRDLIRLMKKMIANYPV